jgi:transcriptional regulator with XRE-family HTH domain
MGALPNSCAEPDFGAWLSEQRRGAGVTQRSLAKKCGLTAGYLATLERNASEPPPLRTCKALARALGIDWEEMWERSLAARLKRWLRRQGHSGIPDCDLLEFVKKIQSASR